MALHVDVPVVSVLLWPIDPEAAIRAPWAMTEVFAGHFRAGSDGGQGAGQSSPAFASLEYKGQPAFKTIDGDLQFLQFARGGRVYSGVPAALKSDPSNEQCGFTCKLRVERLQNRMRSEAFAALAPQSPAGQPVLLWVAEQGRNWETIIPARVPLCASVRHLDTLPNQAVKIKTAKSWDANRGFEAVFDLDGAAWGHEGAQATRLTWGDKWAVVFRGQGANVFPSFERRRTGVWEQVRVLRDNAPLDYAFWTSTHTLRVLRSGGYLVIELDGVAYWTLEIEGAGTTEHAVAASWPRTPLRLSVWGADCALQVHRLTGDAPPDKKGVVKPIELSFERDVPAPYARPGAAAPFKATGTKVIEKDGLKMLLLGDGLDRVVIEGEWAGDVASYKMTMRCTSTDAPFLSAFVCNFPSPARTPAPEPVEVRNALSLLSVDTGDPENLPDAEATFTLAGTLMDKVPGWDTAVLPFRPCLIRAKYPGDATWQPLFRGFLMPQDQTRDTWNAFDVPLRARGPLIRLMAPAALIDERFAPLDIHQLNTRRDLFGCEAVKELLRVELGDSWVERFNGNGDPFRYTRSPFPLLSTSNAAFFKSTLAPKGVGGFDLTPPFGSDLKRWIDTISGFDHAVWFFDAQDDCFCYGRIPEFLRVRSAAVHVVTEDMPLSTDTTKTFPLLSSLMKSGLLEKNINDVRVWMPPAPGAEAFQPGLYTGRAGDDDPTSLDPLSVVQSWVRSLLLKPEFVKLSVVASNYPAILAYLTWMTFKGRPPARLDATFDTGFLGPRWGEILHLPTGFKGPRNGGTPEDWMIVKVVHRFSFKGDTKRFSTVLTTRSLGALDALIV